MTRPTDVVKIRVVCRFGYEKTFFRRNRLRKKRVLTITEEKTVLKPVLKLLDRFHRIKLVLRKRKKKLTPA